MSVCGDEAESVFHVSLFVQGQHLEITVKAMNLIQ